MRKCKCCGVTKDANSFHTNKGYLRWTCKLCTNARARELRTPEIERRYRANKKAAHPDHKVREHLSHRYGITFEEYQELFAKQGGQCAICGSTSPNRPGTTRFHVDHCHTTGEIRGLLCNSCNAGIGRFKDDADVIDRAAAYLRSARTGLIAKRSYSYSATKVIKHHR